MQVPTSCTGVPSEVLYPENAWPDKAQYADTLHRLAEMFTTNFVKYSGARNCALGLPDLMGRSARLEDSLFESDCSLQAPF